MSVRLTVRGNLIYADDGILIARIEDGCIILMDEDKVNFAYRMGPGEYAKVLYEGNITKIQVDM